MALGVGHKPHNCHTSRGRGECHLVPFLIVLVAASVVLPDSHPHGPNPSTPVRGPVQQPSAPVSTETPLSRHCAFTLLFGPRLSFCMRVTTVTAQVVDVNEPPEFLNPAPGPIFLLENATLGTVVAAFPSWDPENDIVTYSLSSVDDGSMGAEVSSSVVFRLDYPKLVLIAPLDFELCEVGVRMSCNYQALVSSLSKWDASSLLLSQRVDVDLGGLYDGVLRLARCTL